MAIQVVSYGGGVNSSAMLIGMQERGERPDLILFADTFGEKPETYQHNERFADWLASVDFPELTVVSNRSKLHQSLEEECHNNETLPSKAYGFSGCSVKWKRQPMDRFLRTWGPAVEQHEQGQQVHRLIGIHAGETRRGRIPDCPKYHYRYPLREWDWGQEQCHEAIKRAGLEVPVKSACFYCPAMKRSEVLSLAKEHPELAQRAVEMEQQAREAGSLRTVKGLGRHWSWEALLKADREQLRLFPDYEQPSCMECDDGE